LCWNSFSCKKKIGLICCQLFLLFILVPCQFVDDDGTIKNSSGWQLPGVSILC